MAKKNDIKLPKELSIVVDNIVKSSDGKSVTEDDIQIALREVDINDEELSDIYDALRAKGVDIEADGDGTLSPDLLATMLMMTMMILLVMMSTMTARQLSRKQKLPMRSFVLQQKFVNLNAALHAAKHVAALIQARLCSRAIRYACT